MRNGHIGYLNKRLYTDVKSYEVFEENGKLFAVKVEKIRVCKPEFIPGGFAAHCANQDEVWRGSKTKEIGEPFEIEKKYGGYGYSAYRVECSFGCMTEDEAKHEMKAAIEDTIRMREIDPKIPEVGYEIVSCPDNKRHPFLLVGYALTKTGRRQRHFVKLGTKIEKACRYYYDYNF